MAIDERELKEEMIEFSNRLASRGLIRGSSGNISTRLGENQYLITPTQLPKGYLRESDIILIDDSGNTLDAVHAPSTDTELHLAAYRARPDVQAVVHAHPLITIAFSVAGKSLQNGMLPEFDYLFPNGVPIVPYRPQEDLKLPDLCQEYITNHDIVILSHHGTLALGHSLMLAWMLTEHLETCFEVMFYAELLNKANTVTDMQISLLRDINSRNKKKSN